ncbi:hypothetical protein M885DRAFT_612686 [Pelagophyceae sp. CCMP2097]|nr:hypothetical protein M885DRAFT_612686 [Pelagophyceae sp. CCMP2097]
MLALVGRGLRPQAPRAVVTAARCGHWPGFTHTKFMPVPAPEEILNPKQYAPFPRRGRDLTFGELPPTPSRVLTSFEMFERSRVKSAWKPEVFKRNRLQRLYKEWRNLTKPQRAVFEDEWTQETAMAKEELKVWLGEHKLACTRPQLAKIVGHFKFYLPDHVDPILTRFLPDETISPHVVDATPTGTETVARMTH